MSHRSITSGNNRRSRLGVLAIAAVLLPSLAAAHVGDDHSSGFAVGLAHPFMGIDHLLAMFAIGIWAVQRGARAVWLFPITFMAMMALGAVLGLTQSPVPAAEFVVEFSVLALGLMIAGITRLPIVVALPMLALFAVMHGYVHAVEISSTGASGSFLAGMLLATASLHLVGIVAARVAVALLSVQPLRWTGVAIAGVGALLLAQ